MRISERPAEILPYQEPVTLTREETVQAEALGLVEHLGVALADGHITAGEALGLGARLLFSIVRVVISPRRQARHE